MKIIPYFLLITVTNTSLGLNIYDDFGDGILDSGLWSVAGDGGTLEESAGVISFVLEEPVSFSSFAVLKLENDISIDTDFRVSADFLYNQNVGDDLAFGITLTHWGEALRSAATYTQNRSVSMGLTNHAPVYDFITGQPINSSIISFEIDYSASNRLISFKVIADEIVLGLLTHSINGSETADLSSDWDLIEGDTFGSSLFRVEKGLKRDVQV